MNETIKIVIGLIAYGAFMWFFGYLDGLDKKEEIDEESEEEA